MARENWVVWLKTPGHSVFDSPNVLRVSMSREGVNKLVHSLVPESFPGAWVYPDRVPCSACWVFGRIDDSDVEPVKETGLFYTRQEDV